MTGNNNTPTPTPTPGQALDRRSWAPWRPPARMWVIRAGLLLVTVLVTQFFSVSPDAARAAALAVWAQDDPARLQAVQRFAACERDGEPGLVMVQGCARNAGGQALGDAMVGVTEVALQQTMEHLPAPMAWFMR